MWDSACVRDKTIQSDLAACSQKEYACQIVDEQLTPPGDAYTETVADFGTEYPGRYPSFSPKEIYQVHRKSGFDDSASPYSKLTLDAQTLVNRFASLYDRFFYAERTMQQRYTAGRSSAPRFMAALRADEDELRSMVGDDLMNELERQFSYHLQSDRGSNDGEPGVK